MSEPGQSAPPPPPAPPAPGEHELSTRIEGLGCPNCAGALDVHFGLRVVTCPYCGTPLLALSEIGIRRLAVRPEIDEARARAMTRRWLTSGMSKEPRLKGEAGLGEAILYFLPFYRVEADCVGFALGTELRRRRVGSGSRRRVQTYEVDVERSAERSFDRTFPAVNVAEWGIHKVRLQGDPLVSFEPGALERQGMVFPPTGSERAVLKAALEQFKLEVDPARGLHRTRSRFLKTLRDRISVVYYPLWLVRYQFRRRSYHVLVDGEDGTLAYGKAPGNDLYRAAVLVMVQAATLFVGTTLLQLIGMKILSLAFVGVPMVAALVWGWRRFRYGGVVVEGTGVTEEPAWTESLEALTQGKDHRQLLGDLLRGGLTELR